MSQAWSCLPAARGLSLFPAYSFQRGKAQMEPGVDPYPVILKGDPVPTSKLETMNTLQRYHLSIPCKLLIIC